MLTAMGIPTDRALAALRLSLGRWSSPDQIDHAAARITHAAAQISAG